MRWGVIVNISKRVVVLGVVGLMIVSIAVLVIVKYYNGKDDISKYTTIVTANITEGGNTWEVHKSYTDQIVILMLNGNIQAKKSFKVKELESKAMKLPDITKLKGKNIIAKDTYSKLTWDASLEDAAEQVKWFEGMGYKVEFKAETQEFIELYMKNEKDEYKRILIMQGQLSVADVKEHEFKTINDYII